MTPEDFQTAKRVFARLTETPEQRREREIQEFMALHGYDRLELTGKDGRRETHLSSEAKQREKKLREAEFQRAQFEIDMERIKRAVAKQQAAEEANYVRITWTDNTARNL